jgi:hypothetical protein
VQKIAEMEFPANDSTVPFKLADGHSYFLHRLVRDGKTTVYALLAAEGASGAFTPYITEHQMDRVLELRAGTNAAASGTLDEKSPTGYVCPGCGAVTTETGVHVGPANAAASERVDIDPTGPKIVFEDGQIELLPSAPKSRFFDRS